MEKKEFRLMRDRKPVVVNVSRASVVNLDFVYYALANNYIKGYLVDEKVKHPVTRFDNFVSTPHIGASTREAQLRLNRLVRLEVKKAKEELGGRKK